MSQPDGIPEPWFSFLKALDELATTFIALLVSELEAIQLRSCRRIGSPIARGQLFFEGSPWNRSGGECEIRTHGTLRYTRFPSVRLKPLGQLSLNRQQREVALLTAPH
jgi:hypothetical protein